MVPECLHDLQIKLGKGHIDLLCLYVRLLRECFVREKSGGCFQQLARFGIGVMLALFAHPVWETVNRDQFFDDFAPAE